MKKMIIALTLMVALLLGGCGASRWEHTVDLPPAQPSDFAIYYEWGYSSDNFLDTYNGTIGKDLIAAGAAKGKIKVSKQMLEDIYLALRRYDIASIPVEVNSQNCAGKGEGSYDMTPCAHYKIRFRADGKEYTVTGDETGQGYEKSQDFFDFVFFMNALIRNTPEYRAFPKAEGGYM